MAEEDELGPDDLSPEAIERSATNERHKRVARAKEGDDIGAMYSAWHTTIDFLFRTNVDEVTRLVDFGNLRSIVFKLGGIAFDRKLTRDALLRLDALLQMQMPSEWFQHRDSRAQIQSAIAAANVEVTDLCRACVRRPQASTANDDAVQTGATAGDVGVQEAGDTASDSMFFLVSRIVSQGRLILSFRTRCQEHPIWHEQLEPQLRPSLRALLLADRAADKVRSDASLDLHLAQRGQWRVGTLPQRRSVVAAQKRYDRANGRWHETRRGLHAVSGTMRRHERLLIRRKLRDFALSFGQLQSRYSTEFGTNVVEVTRRSQGRAHLGAWTGASWCEVLAKVATALVEVLQADCEPSSDFWRHRQATERIEALTRDEWEQLLDGARKEASFVDETFETKRSAGSSRARAATARKTEKRTKRADDRPKPSAVAVDAAAKRCLEQALIAAASANPQYLPSREDLSRAVSKELGYEIGVASLFGTTSRQGRRVPRHPQFMKLWDATRLAMKESRRKYGAKS